MTDSLFAFVHRMLSRHFVTLKNPGPSLPWASAVGSQPDIQRRLTEGPGEQSLTAGKLRARECPGNADYPRYADFYGRGGRPVPRDWNGLHRYKWQEGTVVELGDDAGYFCVYCGKREPTFQERVADELAQERAAPSCECGLPQGNHRC